MAHLRAAAEPGQRIRHLGRPDWGIGQVQSAVGDRVTANFEHAGKVVLNLTATSIEFVEDEA